MGIQTITHGISNLADIAANFIAEVHMEASLIISPYTNAKSLFLSHREDYLATVHVMTSPQF